MTKHNESGPVEILKPAQQQKKKMPEGKQQFGIIVPIEIHKEAKKLAADMDCRFSDVYAMGVERLLADMPGSNVGKRSNKMSGLEPVIDGLFPEELEYVRALAQFLQSDPDEGRLSMLKLILGQFAPKGALDAKMHRKRKRA